MKTLVIGSEGFIGKHLMEQGRAMGMEMVGCDVTGTPDIRQHSSRLLFGHGEYARVIHSAGVLGTQETLSDPVFAVHQNIGEALKMLEKCRRVNVPFTYLTLGNNWLNPYSITKNCMAEFVRMYQHVHGLHTQVAICYNVFGPYQKWKTVRKIVPDFMTKILRNEVIQLFNGGEQECDMVYAPDLAKAILGSNAAGTRHYGSGQPRRVHTVLFDCARALGQEVYHAVDVGPRPGETGPAAFSPYSLPFVTPYDEAMKITAEWYREAIKYEDTPHPYPVDDATRGERTAAGMVLQPDQQPIHLHIPGRLEPGLQSGTLRLGE